MDFQLDLDKETVQHAFPDPPVCVAPESTIEDAIDQLRSASHGCVLICRDKALVGIFTERDAVRQIAKGVDLSTPITEVMVADVCKLNDTDSVKTAIVQMSAGGYRNLPIVDDQDKPVGVLRTAGILHYLVEHFPAVIYNLPPQPHHSTQHREGA